MTTVARQLWPDVPIQGCLWHLRHSTQWTFYRTKIKGVAIREVMRRVNDLIDDVITRRPDLLEAQQQLDDLVALLDNSGLHQGALHLRLARDQAFTFLRRVINIALADRLNHPDWTRLREQLQTPNTTRFAPGEVNG